MKKIFKVLSVFLLFTLVSSICFAAPKKKDPLDAAIRETSDYLNSSITKGSKIVILNIQSESGALSEYIIDELIFNTVNDRILLVVDRQQLDSIRAEQNFQFSGEVDDKQALEIGKFFGAQTIVSGAMSMIGKEYRLRIRALEVQTALVQGQFNKNIAKSTLIPTLIASKPSTATTTTAASTSSGKQTTTTSTTGGSTTPASSNLTIVNNTGKTMVGSVSFFINDRNDTGKVVDISLGGNLQNNQSKSIPLPKYDANTSYVFVTGDTEGALYGTEVEKIVPGMSITFIPDDMFQEAPKVYKIGDKGPAGGIIFYDKGNNSGGWRYLEVAPADVEFRAKWTIKNTIPDNLEAIIGSGRKNTRIIVETFEKTSGEWDTAAQKCADLTFGGFNDWFIPSKDELDQMYGQLKRRNLGDFKNDWYYSSFPYYNNKPLIHTQNFSNGEQGTNWGHHYDGLVRPIRQVAGPSK